jgi:hypothetical protein
MVNDQVLPFQLAVPAQDLARLRARSADTRWPEPQTVSDDSQGTPILATARFVEFTNS